MSILDNDFDILPEDEIPVPRRLRPRGVGTWHLFVYGTMMPGQRNDSRLDRRGVDILGPTRTTLRYTMRTKIAMGGYAAPVLYPGGSHFVRGYLVRVDESALIDIDFYEGHPVVYRRSSVQVERSPYDVHAYLYGADLDDPLTSSGLHYSQDEVYFDGS